MDSTQHQLTFWGAGTVRTFRPIWTAEELGLDYHLQPIGPRTGETQTESYTRLNPKQKVPFMQDEQVELSESVAICRYLLDRYAAPAGFYRPESIADRAREDQWICYFYGELDETGLYVMRRHRDLPEIYGEAPAAVASARSYIEKHLDVIEAHLSDHEHVMGDLFGCADIILVSCLDWAVFYDFQLPGTLDRYRERLSQRPAYREAFEINYRGA